MTTSFDTDVIELLGLPEPPQVDLCPAGDTLHLLPVAEVTRRLGVSRSTIYNWLNRDSPLHRSDFPRPVRVGLRAVRWRSDEIAEWIASRPGR